LHPGVYTVKWQSLSADDDDYADGTYKLTLLRPDGTSPEGSASEAAGEGSGLTGILLALGAAVAVIAIVVGLGWRRIAKQ
jgi:hypothetical protein